LNKFFINYLRKIKINSIERTTKFKNLIELWTKKTTKWTWETLWFKNRLITNLKCNRRPPLRSLIPKCKDLGTFRQKALQIVKTRNKTQTAVSSKNTRNILTISSLELLLEVMAFKTSLQYCPKCLTKIHFSNKSLLIMDSNTLKFFNNTLKIWIELLNHILVWGMKMLKWEAQVDMKLCQEDLFSKCQLLITQTSRWCINRTKIYLFISKQAQLIWQTLSNTSNSSTTQVSNSNISNKCRCLY
jgi:hypothetical protein